MSPLPFTAEQFFGVFRAYNESVWPAQVILLALALLACALVFTRRRWSDVVTSAVLGALWLWLGLAYHWAFFAEINPLAYAFAALSVAGGLLFLWHGVVRQGLRFGASCTPRSLMGFALIGFALLLYPSWSLYAGHAYPSMPTFGLPCPTTLFTIGMLAFLLPPYPRSPLIVPVLWCLVGVQAALLLGVHQDLGLLVAAVVGIALMMRPGEPRGRVAGAP
jgi:hypothetical protein